MLIERGVITRSAAIAMAVVLVMSFIATSPRASEPIQEQDGPGRPPTPVWVKTIAIIGIVIVLVLVVGLLTGVSHGPGMHGG